MIEYKTVAESNNFIILDKYTKVLQLKESYQSESALEDEVFEKLQAAVGESAQDAFAVADFCGA